MPSTQNKIGASEMGRHYSTQWLGNELAVFDRTTRQVHFLNRVAAWIWELALEGRTREEILRRLQEIYPESSATALPDDVGRTLASLTESGLLPQENQEPRG